MIDKEFEEYIEKNNLKTVEDFLEHSFNEGEDHVLSTLKICDYDPFEFFKGYTSKQKSEWFEKIDQLNLLNIIQSDKYPKEDIVKLNKWLKKYITYRTEAIRTDNNIQYYSTVKEQLYIIHLLRQSEIFFPQKISQDINKQAAILSLLLNRADAKFYNHMKLFSPNNHGLSDKSLKKIKDAFIIAGLTEIAEKIELSEEK